MDPNDVSLLDESDLGNFAQDSRPITADEEFLAHDGTAPLAAALMKFKAEHEDEEAASASSSLEPSRARRSGMLQAPTAVTDRHALDASLAQFAQDYDDRRLKGFVAPIHCNWRNELHRALKDNKTHKTIKQIQLSSLRSNGSPANRTVAFWTFLSHSNAILFVTDARTDKCEQLSYPNRCTLSWSFPMSHERFNIEGSITLVNDMEEDEDLAAARNTAWSELSFKARERFTWRHNLRDEEIAEASKSPDPPRPFCLLAIEPKVVILHKDTNKTVRGKATRYEQAPESDSYDQWIVVACDDESASGSMIGDAGHGNSLGYDNDDDNEEDPRYTAAEGAIE